jgi:hypothetical protein
MTAAATRASSVILFLQHRAERRTR